MAILAAITVVGYNGISQRAKVAALVSDLNNAASQLEHDNTVNKKYPNTASDANQGSGLNATKGTVLSYINTPGNSYCLSGTNSGVSYFITNKQQIP